MSTSELPDAEATPAASSHDNLVLTGYIAAIFVSAALLFAVQPLFTKMVLPRLGGAAAVWSVAMVFFQTTLLAGYAYAHLLTRLAPGRASIVIHLGVMIAACLFLPLHIAGGWGRPPADGEAFWLLGLFAASIGLPFFALSANGPLLQAWFVRTDHPVRTDPYFLYAASNLGSFLALISYPLVVEPFVQLGRQIGLWTIGFYALILLIAGCGALVLRFPHRTAGVVDSSAIADAPAPGWRDVAAWVGLAAVPSGLLIAVTAHIATDVAAVPLFWAAPLSLYLLTFVIAFQSRPIIPHWLVVAVQPIFVLGLIFVILMTPFESIVAVIAVHLSVFFICALLCHGELARRRPAPQYLTAFYMWLSAGGMIGGIAVGLVAPHVFNWVAEYPLLIVLAVLCRPGRLWPAAGGDQLALLVTLAVAGVLLFGFRAFDLFLESSTLTVMVGILLGLTVHFWRAPVAFAGIVAFLLFVAGNYYSTNASVHLVRNFFGVLNVADTPDGMYRVLWHGTTGQGTQRVRDEQGNLITGRPEMISEFFEGAGISQVFNAVRERAGGPLSYAVVGLGTGSLACQARPEDSAVYYELDPDIVRIARNPSLFTFITACRPDIQIVQGDARLTLTDAKDGSYDLVFIDAFIGAAIPIHLLTREAMAMYLRKLKPNGIIAMHVSNKNLELASVVAGVANSHGLIVRFYDGGDVQEDASQHKWVPRVAAVARRDEDFGALAKSPFWPVRERDPGQQVWTDNYSNIVGAILRHLKERRQTGD
jgi:hypothetical protein